MLVESPYNHGIVLMGWSFIHSGIARNIVDKRFVNVCIANKYHWVCDQWSQNFFISCHIQISELLMSIYCKFIKFVFFIEIYMCVCLSIIFFMLNRVVINFLYRIIYNIALSIILYVVQHQSLGLKHLSLILW